MLYREEREKELEQLRMAKEQEKYKERDRGREKTSQIREVGSRHAMKAKTEWWPGRGGDGPRRCDTPTSKIENV